MIDHPSLQHISAAETMSSEAATLASEILEGEISIDHSIAKVADLCCPAPGSTWWPRP